MPIYDNVKAYSRSRGLSIHRLEIMSGLANGTISAWRRCSPKISTLQKVAEALNVDMEDLTAEHSEVYADDKART